MIETGKPAPQAVLVGIQLPGVDDVAHAASLTELQRLASTLGYDVVATVTQKRDGIGAALILGKGKLAELATLTGGSGEVGTLATRRQTKASKRFADRHAEAREQGIEVEPGNLPEDEPRSARISAVIVDHDISPSQARNLERAAGVPVLDRTGVIVEIFHRHANSREAKLQVEMARLRYVSPRVRESATGGGRRQGVGAGETDIELDRRKIRDRLAELRRMLDTVKAEDDQRRAMRREELRVALVGYTNAGKSSLMRALTGSEVLVADKLFATLDTTVRALQPETKPRVLLSDTVGFIKGLPHDLVASFRSTLAEALDASLLLYVVDASDPTWEEQFEVTRTVLREIGADRVPWRLVFNKIDRIDGPTAAALRAGNPEAILISAQAPDDVARLRAAIIAFFEAAMVEDRLVLPYRDDRLLGEVYDTVRVISQEYDEDGRIIGIRGSPGAIARLRRLLATRERVSGETRTETGIGHDER